MSCRAWVLPVALAAGTALATGARAGDEAYDHDAMMEAWMKAAIPGEPHAYLEDMVGEWKTVTTHYENGVKGEPSEGTATFESLLGGRCVRGVHRGNMWGQPFEGMSMEGFDNITGRYWSTWIDNMSTGLYVTYGSLLEDGKTLDYRGTMTTPDGHETGMHFVTVREGDDRFTMTGYMTVPGSDEEVLTMVIEYSRASS